ncbi:aminotransferase class IV family protein [Sulfurovum sp. XTW-4]|uniref:Aminotransferase class IV family protein n=1 Tax=Sulfurovum xiamenensis TaxID=3019066 RepID=A0ABT7QS96_9BACT|nr:aminotransferase class IV family protein [Sulfurovum xiamenensis]MDM5263906.1 aminotransferase class IV family protein [Sulfurovum xiamenensis]
MPQEQSKTPLLLETIRIEEGKIHNLGYHQQRCDKSRQLLFNSHDILDLSSYIDAPKSGLYRCRILYAEHLHSIEYIPYTPKEIQSLRIVSSEIEYSLKYANRDALNALLESNKDVDEVIIEKKGYLTDTTISNIAFLDGEQWITPAKPLLEGTMRAKLIDEGFLHPKQITKEDLKNYSQVALMNAMIGFKILNIEPYKIS